MQDPGLLAGQTVGVIPGTNAKAVQLVMRLGHNLLHFALELGARAGLPLKADIGGAAGLIARQIPKAILLKYVEEVLLRIRVSYRE